MISRDSYLDKLDDVRNKQIIKALTGVRRSGKSTILQLYQDRLKNEGVVDEQIQNLNFEDLGISNLLDYHKLYDYLQSHLLPDKMNYIFLDEIQNVPHFEKVLDSLVIKRTVDLYVTGSNAFMLSGELATLLSGRYIELHVFPLSFKEFYPTTNQGKDLAFESYLDYGGFPFAVSLGNTETYHEYVDGIVNTVLIKDVLTRKKLTNATLVRELAQFLTDTTGNLVTPKKIADVLTHHGMKTSAATVSSYLDGFIDAYLFYRCNRYDIQALIGTKRPNFGSRLEAVVYMELKRRGNEIYVGNLGNREIDFIAVKNGVKTYYQVSLSVKNEKTYQREVRGLREIKDNFRKVLLTEDPGNYNDNGIEQKNVVDWLLEK